MSLDQIKDITFCPSSGGCVLKYNGLLVVVPTDYLLGKHGAHAKRAGSRFLKVKSSDDIIYLVQVLLRITKLKGQVVEIKEVDLPHEMGLAENGLVKLNSESKKKVVQKEIGGHKVNVLMVPEQEILPTSKVNIVFGRFDSKYGNGIEKEFLKLTGVSFEEFRDVYSVFTVYPGKFAPPFENKHFWNSHALLGSV